MFFIGHRRSRLQRFAALVMVTALGMSAAPAAAFDSTGTYDGKYKCTGFSGQKTKFTAEIPLKVTQSGAFVGIDYNNGGFLYSGIAMPNADKPDKGEIAVVICGTNNVLGANGNYDEIGRLKVTTKPAKGTGKLDGVSIYTDPAGDVVFTCKWKFKRNDTGDPGTATSCH